MEKRNTLQLLLAGALVGGALYFLFYTERGRHLLDRLVETATDKMDEWLAALEMELTNAENEVTDEIPVGHS